MQKHANFLRPLFSIIRNMGLITKTKITVPKKCEKHYCIHKNIQKSGRQNTVISQLGQVSSLPNRASNKTILPNAPNRKKIGETIGTNNQTTEQPNKQTTEQPNNQTNWKKKKKKQSSQSTKKTRSNQRLLPLFFIPPSHLHPHSFASLLHHHLSIPSPFSWLHHVHHLHRFIIFLITSPSSILDFFSSCLHRFIILTILIIFTVIIFCFNLHHPLFQDCSLKQIIQRALFLLQSFFVISFVHHTTGFSPLLKYNGFQKTNVCFVCLLL